MNLSLAEIFAIAGNPGAATAFGKQAGVGGDLQLASCSRLGGFETSMSGEDAAQYLTGPHPCTTGSFSSEKVVADPAGFVESAAGILVRLVPLWKTYLENL